MLTDDLMTIRELAEKIGTTKNKVAYQASKIGDEYIEVIDGVKHLNKHAQKVISDEIKRLNSDELNSALNAESEEKNNSNDAIVIELLQQRIKSLENNLDTLNDQLETKDKQINQLHTIIATQTQQANIKALEHDNDKKWWQKFFK